MVEPKRILILDDSAIVLEVVGDAFKAEGWETLAAADLAGLEAALNMRPDVLVIDVNMPEAFGDDVGAVLRDVRGMSLPMVLFSSLNERELAARAEEQGFNDYVSKDAGVHVLVDRIRTLLEE
jgi:DNA-binding response OmpR family regulator